jgi:hypothetical protein
MKTNSDTVSETNINNAISVRYEILTEAKMSVLILWVVTPSDFVGRYESFKKTYCFLLHGNAIYVHFGTSVSSVSTNHL